MSWTRPIPQQADPRLQALEVLETLLKLNQDTHLLHYQRQGSAVRNLLSALKTTPLPEDTYRDLLTQVETKIRQGLTAHYDSVPPDHVKSIEDFADWLDQTSSPDHHPISAVHARHLQQLESAIHTLKEAGPVARTEAATNRQTASPWSRG
jgi:hypothetical protein